MSRRETVSACEQLSLPQLNPVYSFPRGKVPLFLPCGSQRALMLCFTPQRSVVQTTPSTPKAGPVQQLAVQGLQQVHVTQEVTALISHSAACLTFAGVRGLIMERCSLLIPEKAN